MAKAYKCDMCAEFYEGYTVQPQGKRHIEHGYAGLFIRPRRTPPSGMVSDVLYGGYDDNPEIDICKSCLLNLVVDLSDFIANH